MFGVASLEVWLIGDRVDCSPAVLALQAERPLLQCVLGIVPSCPDLVRGPVVEALVGPVVVRSMWAAITSLAWSRASNSWRQMLIGRRVGFPARIRWVDRA